MLHLIFFFKIFKELLLNGADNNMDYINYILITTLEVVFSSFLFFH